MTKKFILIFYYLTIFQFNPAYTQEDLRFYSVEEVRFSIQQFNIVGNLYLPKKEGKCGVAIWIHGDGPDLRTGRPGSPPQPLAPRAPSGTRPRRRRSLGSLGSAGLEG